MGSKSKQKKHQSMPALRARWINAYELTHLIMHLLVDAKTARKEVNIIGSPKAAKLEGVIIGLMSIKEFIEQRSFIGDVLPITAPTGGATDGLTEEQSPILGEDGKPVKSEGSVGRPALDGGQGQEVREVCDRPKDGEINAGGRCEPEAIPPVSDAPGRIPEEETPRG